MTSVQDAILDACYASGLAAEEEEEDEEDNKVAGEGVVNCLQFKQRQGHGQKSAEGGALSFDEDEGSGGSSEADGASMERPPFVHERERSALKFVGCGRTDVSVSATHQVVSLRLKRAKYFNANNEDLESSAESLKRSDNGSAEQHTRDRQVGEEISYSCVLNLFLPPEIRVLAWSFVDDDFSARFNCTQRSYVYHFPKGQYIITKLSELEDMTIRDGCCHTMTGLTAKRGHRDNY